MRTMLMFLALILFGAISAAPATECIAEGQARAEAEQSGIVTALSGELAQQISRIMWRAVGKVPPMVDSVLVVARKDGTIQVIPVTNGQVCLASLKTTEEVLMKSIAAARAELK